MTQATTIRNRSLQRSINKIPKSVFYSLGVLPGLWALYLAIENRLGADPAKSLEHILGLWALRFIIIGLAVSPFKMIGLNLVRYRRAFGLLAFFYALAHFLVYISLDRDWDAFAILKDILKRPYITVGLFAFLILLPLAITSNAKAIKRMGLATWQKLHRWVYIAAIAASIHFIMAVKSWPAEPLIYTAIIIVLLSFRLFLKIKSGFRRDRI